MKFNPKSVPIVGTALAVLIACIFLSQEEFFVALAFVPIIIYRIYVLARPGGFDYQINRLSKSAKGAFETSLIIRNVIFGTFIITVTGVLFFFSKGDLLVQIPLVLILLFGSYMFSKDFI